MRFNLTSRTTCIQVGTEGDRTENTELESAFDIVKNVSIVHFSLASTGQEIGIAFSNTLRRCELHNVHVQGFNINVSINAFGIDMRRCYIEGGNISNLQIGPQANSIMVVGCRFDAQRNANDGENVQVTSANRARSILFMRCDIQRSQRVAFRAIGVSSLAIRDCFFEGNNRDDGSHPDIWIEGENVRNVVIDGCYFTGTGRFGAKSSRAINIRSNVEDAARFQITNNEAANSIDKDGVVQGLFTLFIGRRCQRTDADRGVQQPQVKRYQELLPW